MRAYEDTWFWNAEAQQRVTELKRASTPVGAAIRGLEEILGGSGMLAYLSYMAQRLIELQRVLKETGSIYLHCDPTASHYLKVVLDAVFGAKNFRNEIVWHYYNVANVARKHFGRKHDILFWFSKSADTTFNWDDMREEYSPNSNWVKSSASYGDDRYKPNERGKLMHDVWRMPTINNMAKERLGYPTQKPLALLNRIILASSNPGDIVLDPFIGSGTTAEAAADLNRRFIGIDIASYMLDLTQKRLGSHPVATFGVPQHLEDAARLVRENAFAFEKWAIERIPGLLANQVQVGDGGIDGVGRIAFPLDGAENDLVLAQVKGGHFRPNDLRAFRGVMASEAAALGIFITLHKVKDQQRRNAERELAGFGTLQQGAWEFPRLQLWSIEEYYEDRLPQLPTLAHPYTGKALEGPLI